MVKQHRAKLFRLNESELRYRCRRLVLEPAVRRLHFRVQQLPQRQSVLRRYREQAFRLEPVRYLLPSSSQLRRTHRMEQELIRMRRKQELLRNKELVQVRNKELVRSRLAREHSSFGEPSALHKDERTTLDGCFRSTPVRVHSKPVPVRSKEPVLVRSKPVPEHSSQSRVL